MRASTSLHGVSCGFPQLISPPHLEARGHRASGRSYGVLLLAPASVGAGEPAIVGVVFEHRPELPPTAVQPGHHGTDWGAHDVGDLLICEAFDVGEVNR